MHHSHTFNPNHLDEAAVTLALAEGQHAPVLQAYFGAAAHEELGVLAQQALTTKIAADAPRVLLLPGLLGSKLMAGAAQNSELLWLDPAAVQAGKLMQLAIGRRRPIRAAGVMLPAYLKLKLMLQAAGFDVQCLAYDWRRSIVELGALLVKELLYAPQREHMLVAHSMGGLVARVALKHPASSRVSRVVQLGTPNQGSFALLQTLRGVYPTVRKLAAVDHHHSAAQLARSVFQSFYSFFEMLPGSAYTPGVDLFDAQQWPVDELSPPAQRLKLARRLPRYLACADRRCHVIAGTGLETITSIRRQDRQFVFQTSLAGDGTVPTALAQWQCAQHWYVNEQHGQLPRSTRVGQAVIELLLTEFTRLLAGQPSDSSTLIAERTEAELQQLTHCKIRWDHLPLNERRELLEPVISPAFASACS